MAGFHSGPKAIDPLWFEKLALGVHLGHSLMADAEICADVPDAKGATLAHLSKQSRTLRVGSSRRTSHRTLNRSLSCGGFRPWKGMELWQTSAPHPSHSREVRERAVSLVFSAMESTGERHGHVTRLARQLDIGPETLRKGSTRPRSIVAPGRA